MITLACRGMMGSTTALASFALMALGAAAQGARPEPAGSKTVQLTGADFSLDAPLNLYFDQKLTLVMPGEVRLVLPGSRDVIEVGINRNIVAVSLVDSEYVRIRKPVSTLVVVMRDGTTVVGRIQTAGSAREVTHHLVRFERQDGFESVVRAQALRLVDGWVADLTGPESAGFDERLSPLEPVVEARVRRRIAGWIAKGGMELVELDPRTKRGFIYLTCRGMARLGAVSVVWLAVTNHSQPTFTIGPVRLRIGAEWLEPPDVTVAVSDNVAASDGEARGIAIVVATDRLRDAPMAAEVCEAGPEGRCVRLEALSP